MGTVEFVKMCGRQHKDPKVDLLLLNDLVRVFVIVNILIILVVSC